MVTYDDAVDILVVEDNKSDRDSIVDSLKAVIPDVQVLAVSSGDEALDFLFRRGPWKERASQDPPRLVLLDLALPATNGFSVLGQIRSFETNDALTLTPVVVFSSSQTAGDITECYRCGANSYIMKPLSYPNFQAVVESVGQYWMNHNRAAQ